ncbi:MAG: hypothetical protein WCG95_04305 [bacterium]
MGMSASQSRLLSLTARLSDLELSAQNISNSKIRLADQSEQASKAYLDALDKEKLTVISSDTLQYIDATAHNLTTYNAVSTLDKQRFLKDFSGRVVVGQNVASAYGGGLSSFLATFAGTPPDAGAVAYYTNVYNEIAAGGYNVASNSNLNDTEWLYQQLKSGNIFLSEWDSTSGPDGAGDFIDVSWTSGDATLQTKSDPIVLAKTQAQYEVTMASIQSKDKRFDMELQTINTEHSAIQTEITSVQKVIDKNIQRSFKSFDA